MEKPMKYYQNDSETEEFIHDVMDHLDVEEAENLLRDYKIDESTMDRPAINSVELNDIKKRVSDKTGLNIIRANLDYPNNKMEKTNLSINPDRTKRMWRKAIAAALIVVIGAFVWQNNDSLVYAFQKMFGLIPGVGILEGEEEIKYQLKETVKEENKKSILNILNVVATDHEMTVSISVEKKGITEKQLIQEKKEEQDRLMKENKLEHPDLLLWADNQWFEMEWQSSAGGGLTDFITATIDLDQIQVHPLQTYKIRYQDYDISGVFQLVRMKQYSSLDEIGPTKTFHNISLTATASQEDGKLNVNVYPINYSNDSLLSFISEYNFNYFNKKITLKTENGEKGYDLPDSYGSGMNASYTFDISDGSKEFLLQIPGLIVESEEKGKITLPIPDQDQSITVNKEVEFEEGTVFVTSVEKVIEESGNPYGEIKINLDYKSKYDNKPMVAVKFTRNRSEGWYEEYDDNGRLISIHYMLEKSDKKKMKFSVVKPRYVLLTEYDLKLNQ